uniref:Far upstream element-binding protein C-terminal domain-containing protein n=1 Tax=Panagrolaimus sp. ES5 TaxID=591445 RepID=A0AC34FZ59_9BILA
MSDLSQVKEMKKNLITAIAESISQSCNRTSERLDREIQQNNQNYPPQQTPFLQFQHQADETINSSILDHTEVKAMRKNVLSVVAKSLSRSCNRTSERLDKAIQQNNQNYPPPTPTHEYQYMQNSSNGVRQPMLYSMPKQLDSLSRVQPPQQFQSSQNYRGAVPELNQHLIHHQQQQEVYFGGYPAQNCNQQWEAYYHQMAAIQRQQQQQPSTYIDGITFSTPALNHYSTPTQELHFAPRWPQQQPLPNQNYAAVQHAIPPSTIHQQRTYFENGQQHARNQIAVNPAIIQSSAQQQLGAGQPDYTAEWILYYRSHGMYDEAAQLQLQQQQNHK